MAGPGRAMAGFGRERASRQGRPNFFATVSLPNPVRTRLMGMGYGPTLGPPGIPPKLRVALVPSTCWLSNVRSLMKEWAWRKLKDSIAEMGEYRCEVCRGQGRKHPVECHEVWGYDDERRVQALLRLQALCPMCHRVKHLGRSINLGYEEVACGWLARVNGWDAATTSTYVDAAFRQWSARSQHGWTLDLTTLGEVYEVSSADLGLSSYVLAPHERKQMQRRSAVSAEDIYSRDGRATH